MKVDLPKPDPGHKVLLIFSIVSLAALVNGVNRKVAPLKSGIQDGNPELDFWIGRGISGPAPIRVE